MKDNNPLDSLLNMLPNAAKNLKNEVEGVGDNLLKNKLKHLDVVSREEFEEQTLILKALLEKVDAIENMIETLKKSMAESKQV